MTLKSMRIAAAALLLMMCGSVVASAEYDYPGTVRPGDTIGFDQTEFFDARGNYLIGDVELTTSNFEISKRTIKTGANLVESIKINNRSNEVQVVFADTQKLAAPKRPNVVINELAVRARRSLRDSGGSVVVTSGTVYKLDGPINFRVGLETESWDVDRNGTNITLTEGDRQYIEWDGGGDGLVTVNYGDVATLEGRVYSGDKILYSYSSEVDEDLDDANPSAYISACDMGSSSFTGSTKLYLYANEGDNIYEYNNGKLSAATGLKWSDEDYAWVGKINKAKCYVFSDTKLRSVSGATVSGTTSDSDDDDEDDVTSKDPTYYNPETGGGSNIAVAISAIAAILAISVVSIIMSTIVSVKKK